VDSSPLAQDTIQRDVAEVKKEYFAHRMAIAHLSLGSYTDASLFFSVGDIDGREMFWVDVLEYFRKLSLTRQVIVITPNPKLGETITGGRWPFLSVS